MKYFSRLALAMILILSVVAVGTTACSDDEDTAGITVTPTSGLVTTEAGCTAQFTIVLDSKPSADVTIGVSSNDTSEGTVSPASVTFTTSNWSTPQTITISGVDDTEDDGNIAYKIITALASSDDSDYSVIDAADVSMSNNARMTYKVGAILSLTGGASSLGIPEENTANMIVDQINSNGGINGHKLEVIIYDDESVPANAATLATRLIEQDKVLTIVGPTTSGSSLAIIDIVTNAEIPLVSCAASAEIVTPVEDRYWVFKTPQTDQEAVTEIYTYMQDNGITKVALLTATSGFGVSGLNFLKSDAADYGIEIVAEQTFDEKDASVESQLTVIKGTDAEAIISWAITSDTVTIALDMKTLNMTIPLYASHGIANMDFIEDAGDAANGVIFPAGKLLFVDQVPDSDPQKQTLVDYVADYEALYGEDTVSTFGGHMYDALMIVINALEQMDECLLDKAEASAAIRDAIEEDTIAFAGTGGVFTMSATNHLGMAAGSLGMIKIVDGEWTLAP